MNNYVDIYLKMYTLQVWKVHVSLSVMTLRPGYIKL